MELELKRRIFTSESTIGELFIDGQYQCFILEDITRPATEAKVYGKTAIPYGRYEVIISYSNRFKKLTPRLLNVPQFEGILIHPGNTSANTDGCLLPGETKAKDFVGNSKIAYDKLFKRLQAAVKKGKVFITITRGE